MFISPLLFLPAAVYVIIIIVFLFGGSYIVSVVMNLFFNFYMLALSLTGILKLRSISTAPPKNEIMSFLFLSSGLYIILLIFGTVFAAGLFKAQRVFLSIGITGVFCLSWAGFLLYTGLQRATLSGRELNGLPESFLISFAVSQREADVAVLIASGAANREIAEKLYISTRTVEAHIYNLYRKCGCRNKVEFINKIQTYKITE